MNKNVEFVLKWGLVLGIAVFAARYFLDAKAKTVSPIPALPAPNMPDSASYPTWGLDDRPFCEIFPDDPLCSSFGGAGEAWI